MSLRRPYASATMARRLAAALEADQPPGLRWRVRGAELLFEFTAVTPESARATADDLLACLSAAERTAGAIPTLRSAPGRPRRGGP